VSRELIPAILADRSAALICLGLTALDDRTIAFFADHPSLLERIYLRSATAFGAFSSSLQIDGNRIIPPGGPRPSDAAAARPPQGSPQTGGDDVVALWEGVVAEKVTRPERFITQLLELNEGRLAFLYDTIGQLDPPRRAFALGLWMNRRRAGASRLVASVDATASRPQDAAVRPRVARPLDDARCSGGQADGAPRQPAPRRAVQRRRPPRRRRARCGMRRRTRSTPRGSPGAVGRRTRLRSERLDQLAFGQRVFGAADASSAATSSWRSAMSRYRMLVWTLEAWNHHARRARPPRATRFGSAAPEGRRGADAQAQFQGTLALLARMTAVRRSAPRPRSSSSSSLPCR
jgi:hypothetical protein